MKGSIDIRVSEDLKTALLMGKEFTIHSDEGGHYILIYDLVGTPQMYYLSF